MCSRYRARDRVNGRSQNDDNKTSVKTSSLHSQVDFATAQNENSDKNSLAFDNVSLTNSVQFNMNLGINRGILVEIHIPKEYSVSGNLMESAIKKALKEARST